MKKRNKFIINIVVIGILLFFELINNSTFDIKSQNVKSYSSFSSSKTPVMGINENEWMDKYGNVFVAGSYYWHSKKGKGLKSNQRWIYTNNRGWVIGTRIYKREVQRRKSSIQIMAIKDNEWLDQYGRYFASGNYYWDPNNRKDLSVNQRWIYAGNNGWIIGTKRHQIPTKSDNVRKNSISILTSKNDCYVYGFNICNLKIKPVGMTRQSAIKYLKRDLIEISAHPTTFQRVISMLPRIPEIRVGSTGEFWGSRWHQYLSYNPRIGVNGNCYLSPAIILVHEAGHANNFYSNPQRFYREAGTIECTGYDTFEERRVIEGWQRDATMALSGCHNKHHGRRPAACDFRRW